MKTDTITKAQLKSQRDSLYARTAMLENYIEHTSKGNSFNESELIRCNRGNVRVSLTKTPKEVIVVVNDPEAGELDINSLSFFVKLMDSGYGNYDECEGVNANLGPKLRKLILQWAVNYIK